MAFRALFDLHRQRVAVTAYLPPPPTKPVNQTGPILGLVGAGVVIVASFLPWLTLTTLFGTVNIAGTQGDGKITLVLGGILGVVSLLQLNRSTNTTADKVAMITLSVAVLAISVFEYSNVQDRLGEVQSEYVAASIGIGIYGLFGGGALALWGAEMKR